MQTSTFADLLLSTQNALLPATAVMAWALRGAWAVVLASGVLLLVDGWPSRHRWSLALLVLLWTLMPGTISPAHWLGLAFQMPSLTSVFICLAWLAGRFFPAAAWTGHEAVEVRTRSVMVVAGIVMGWVLLLDMLAWLPFSLYNWGFAPLAVAGAALAAALFWAVLGGGQDDVHRVDRVGHPRLVALPLLVMVLFVLTRLPSGNLWDALIDPWLWLVLQFRWLVSGACRLRMARRLPPATRV